MAMASEQPLGVERAALPRRGPVLQTTETVCHVCTPR